MCRCCERCRLRLSYNKLANLPPTFGRLSWLRDLRLDNNFMNPESFPHSFASLEVEHLDLCNNSVRLLPAQIANMKYLTHLDLRWVGVPVAVVSLRTPRVSATPTVCTLAVVHDNGRHHVRVTGLCMSLRPGPCLRRGNKLSKVDTRMLKLLTLKTVYLSNNRLHELPWDFQRLTKYAVIPAHALAGAGY